MTPEAPTRKLAAIMFTDMVGYTSLMQKDEVQARELVQNHREIIKPLIEKHAGEVIQYVGDGTFSTFGSAIEAVNCAAEIQRHLLDVKGISVRIGLHVGDVVVEGEEVYGDGVNVASRLEPLAEPGGIFISGRVYDDINDVLEHRHKQNFGLSFEFISSRIDPIHEILQLYWNVSSLNYFHKQK